MGSSHPKKCTRYTKKPKNNSLKPSVEFHTRTHSIGTHSLHSTYTIPTGVSQPLTKRNLVKKSILSSLQSQLRRLSKKSYVVNDIRTSENWKGQIHELINPFKGLYFNKIRCNSSTMVSSLFAIDKKRKCRIRSRINNLVRVPGGGDLF